MSSDSPLTKDELIDLLRSQGEEQSALFQRARQLKEEILGDKVYFRGLVEFSNVCRKDCLYCGIRASNPLVTRYDASDDEILAACRYACEQRYGSVVLQSGERTSSAFVEHVDMLLNRITELSDGELGITLSCGEQPVEVYQRWRESGAHRYLLRIETSCPDLYRRLHPDDDRHRFERRLQALDDLRSSGYQVGTGVMIGLPFQTLDHLADDLLFMKQLDVDMVGMGPYIEHEDTPLHAECDALMSRQNRFTLSLKMIACLRLLMPDINIAAATALQAIDPVGREKAIVVGANVIMPNLTPCAYRKDYKLYEDKPCVDEDASQCRSCLEARIAMTDHQIAFGQRGDSLHFRRRTELL